MDRRSGLKPLIGAVLLVAWVAIGTIGFVLIEDWSVVDAIYMTVITISTVGFKEAHPLSDGGKLFAIFVIIGGLGTAGYTLTRVARLLLEGELLDILGRRRMKSNLDKLRGHHIVCGYGRIGKPVVLGLERDGLPFCVIDRDAAMEEEFQRHGRVYIIGDATDEEALRMARIDTARALLALLPSDADNLYLAMTARSLNPSLRIIARAQDEKAEAKLKRGGADQTVSVYRIAAHRVLHAAIKPAVVEFMKLVTQHGALELNLEEVEVSNDSSLAGRSLAESDIRRSCGVIVVAIKNPSGEMIFNPDASETIAVGDTLVAMGQEEELKKLENLCGSAT